MFFLFDLVIISFKYPSLLFTVFKTSYKLEQSVFILATYFRCL